MKISKVECLPVHSRSHQGEQDSGRAHEGNDRNTRAMRRRHESRARICDARTTRVAEKPEVVALKRWREQGIDPMKRRVFVQLRNLQCLKGLIWTDRFQELPGELRRFDDEVSQTPCHIDRALRQHGRRRHHAKQVRHQIETP